MSTIQDILSEENVEKLFLLNKAVILKNSTACPISSRVRREFRKFSEECADDIQLFIVDVIQNRPLSALIAEKTGVRHESPQVIILENGSVKWSGSHWDITEDAIKTALG